MLLSHRYRFIFVKTEKTAGTSTEISLSRYCGPEDVVTPLAPRDEAIRKKIGHAPRNFGTPQTLGPEKNDLFLRLSRTQWSQRKIFWNHITAGEIRRKAPDEWAEYLTFTIVRNPWDAFVSKYFHRRTRKEELTLDQAFDEFDPNINWRIYTIDDEIAVDLVLRFEHLQDDISAAAERLGIQFDGWLPRAKADTGRNGLHYRDVLKPRHVKAIRRACSKEIEEFGYTF